MTNRNHSKGLVDRVSAVLARFRRRRNGAVAPILALALIPILGAMGFGAEVSNWWLVQRSAQNAADSAVLAAAIDAGNNMTGTTGYPTATPTNNSCTTVPGPSASWYCQAISTAAGYSYTRSATIMVEPAVATCPNVIITSQCYQVTITKLVPIYLLGVLGFNGTDVVGGAKYQRITSTALAAAPGPPVDFCILTTNGDFVSSGAPSANMQQCSIFANGSANCNGHSLGIYADYASNTASCPRPDINTPDQSYLCDPYGSTTQTFPYNNGNSGTFSESCPLATNASGNIPDSTCGSYNPLASSDPSFPPANVITQAQIAAGGVVAVCGNAALGAGTVDAKTGVTGCSSAISYTGAANLEIIVYNGSLNFNGCTLQNSEPSATQGGMTILLAPPLNNTVQTCPNACVLLDTNKNPGTLDIAAPTSGTYSGIAIMQSANYADGGDCSGQKAPLLDWCDAGNSPTLAIQGVIYMPNSDITWSGAISKFQQPGALNCVGIIAESLQTNGTAWALNNFGTASITGQCTTAGATLPGVPHSHTFYQALVG